MRCSVKKAKRPDGFSLIELIISLAVISILMGTMAPLVTRFGEITEIRNTKAELDKMEPAFLAYFQDVGNFPLNSPTQGIRALVVAPNGNLGANSERDITVGTVTVKTPPTDAVSDSWRGPYLAGNAAELSMDDWSNSYNYTLQVNQVNYDVNPADPTAATYPAANFFDLFNLRLTQVVIITSNGPDRTIGGGDDLSINISSRPVANAILASVAEKLRVINANLSTFNVNQWGALTNAQGAASTAIDRDCAADAGPIDTINGAITDTSVPPNPTPVDLTALFSCYYRRDNWGRPWLWNSQRRQFYSMGPDQIDHTGCVSTPASCDDPNVIVNISNQDLDGSL